VGRQLFDSLDVAGAAVEAAANVGMFGAAGAPLQDATLYWPQRVPGWRDAAAGHLGVGDHPVDELRSAPEAACDVVVLDAVGDEAQDAAFHRPQ